VDVPRGLSRRLTDAVLVTLALPVSFAVSGVVGVAAVAVRYPVGLLGVSAGMVVSAVVIGRSVRETNETGGRGPYYVCGAIFAAVLAGLVVGAWFGYPARGPSTD
jgi:hypothetical protein